MFRGADNNIQKVFNDAGWWKQNKKRQREPIFLTLYHENVKARKTGYLILKTKWYYIIPWQNLFIPSERNNTIKWICIPDAVSSEHLPTSANNENFEISSLNECCIWLTWIR